MPSECIADAVNDLLQTIGITSWDSVVTALVTLLQAVRENEERPCRVNHGRYTDRRSDSNNLGNIHPDFYGPNHGADRRPTNRRPLQCHGGNTQSPRRFNTSQQAVCGNGRRCTTSRGQSHYSIFFSS